MKAIRLWALRASPNELRGIILDELPNFVRISSFLLQENRYIDIELFKEHYIILELAIPEDIIELAEKSSSPIIFKPGSPKQKKYSIKKY